LPRQDVKNEIGGMEGMTERFGTGGLHRRQTLSSTALRISTICRLPSTVLANLRRICSIAAAALSA
jgi:hypothetical protein